MLSPLDLVRRTPLSNCRQCGHPSCLAFAAAVLKTGQNPAACPFIDLHGLDLGNLQVAAKNGRQDQKDLEFIAFLKAKIAAADFSRLAGKLGAMYRTEPMPALVFQYLGQEVVLSKECILINGSEPLDHRDKILLYNYVHSGGGRPAAGDWLGMESLPNSISKIKTLATYCEDRLALLLTGCHPEKFYNIVTQLHGVPAKDHSASLAAYVPVLPMLPQYILFWQAEEEDNFPAKAKVLFDRNVLDFLDLESLVFTAERLADRIELLWQL